MQTVEGTTPAVEAAAGHLAAMRAAESDLRAGGATAGLLDVAVRRVATARTAADTARTTALLGEAYGHVPGLADARAATARLREHIAAQPDPPSRNPHDPVALERDLAGTVLDLAATDATLPGLAELAEQVSVWRGLRSQAEHHAAAVLRRAVAAAEANEANTVRAGVDHALWWLAGRLDDLLAEARPPAQVLGGVRVDDDPDPARPAHVIDTRPTVGGMTARLPLPGTRLTRAEATPAQRAAWQRLTLLADQYRPLRRAQEQLVALRHADHGRRRQLLALAGELADLDAIWPDWDRPDGAGAVPPPWGATVGRGADAGPDFLAWAGGQRPGTVWLPGLDELQRAADRARERTRARRAPRSADDALPAGSGRRRMESLRRVNETLGAADRVT